MIIIFMEQIYSYRSIMESTLQYIKKEIEDLQLVNDLSIKREFNDCVGNGSEILFLSETFYAAGRYACEAIIKAYSCFRYTTLKMWKNLI